MSNTPTRPVYLLRFPGAMVPHNQYQTWLIELVRAMHLRTTILSPEEFRDRCDLICKKMHPAFDRCKPIDVRLLKPIGGAIPHITFVDRRGIFCSIELLPIGNPTTL